VREALMLVLIAYLAIGCGLLGFAAWCDRDNELTLGDMLFTAVAWPLVLLTAIAVLMERGRH
jgi:hypothetical protein